MLLEVRADGAMSSCWSWPCAAGIMSSIRRKSPRPKATCTSQATTASSRDAPWLGEPLSPGLMDRERSRSKVLRRAETAGRALSDGSPSPAKLRVVQDALVQEHYSFSGDVAGVGMNGAVRVVTDKRTNQRRVVKSIIHANAEDRLQWSELLNEMEVYLRLDHPNICRLLEVYVQEDAIHLIMELCTGKDLFERWDAKGRYDELETAIAVMQMLDALQYLHCHEVCHRDLKLENWVYADQTPNARLKLIDFGFSKVVTPDTPMTAVLGTAFYIAPEVLAGSYDCKCDVWSTGVITYMLLTGTPPFGDFDEPDATILQKVKRGASLRTSREWKGISQEGRNFVMSLMTRDPVKRPSAREAATHLWLQQSAKGSHCQAPEISKEVLENLRSFASMNVIKRAACCLIAYSMSVEETDYLEAQFKKLDKGRNGTISVQELVDALKETLNMTEATARDLFSQLVLTGDREIHYSEFLAAASQKRFLTQEGFIREAFKRFDVDKTGYISVDDLRSVLGDEYCGTRVEDILAQVDASGDGLIEYEEFVRALMDLGTYVPEQRDQSRPRAIVQRISRAFDFTSMGGLSQRLARSWPRGLCTAGNAEEHIGLHNPAPPTRALSDDGKPKLDRGMGHTRSLSDSAKEPRGGSSPFASALPSEALAFMSEAAAAPPAVEASV